MKCVGLFSKTSSPLFLPFLLLLLLVLGALAENIRRDLFIAWLGTTVPRGGA